MVKLITFLMTAITFLSNLFGVNMRITVSDIKCQEISGFGTSAAWWAQEVDTEETREMLAKALYSKEGLGLNIYRYNVGGGSNPEKERIPLHSRRTESFYYYNEESGQYEYDFTRDANAQKMLEKALSYGCIDTVVLFANSPHYSMTVNGETYGDEKGVSNLDSSRYQDFVDYFLTVTEYFINKGVPVKYISPINEPQWDWGGEYANQEGCHYETDQMIELLELFAKGIQERGLSVKLMTPESGQIGEKTEEYFDRILANETISSELGSLAYHSYWEDANLQNKVDFGQLRKTKWKNQTVDMTEWCELPCKHDIDDLQSAIIMARVIANDLYFEHCNSWSSWVAVNLDKKQEDGRRYSDGMFHSDDDDFEELKMTMRYYAFAHFSKFIPSGSVMLQSTTNRMNTKDSDNGFSYFLTDFVAFRTPEGEKVVVIVNEDEAQKINLTVTGGRSWDVYTTDENHKLEKTDSGKAKCSVQVAKNSITTIVYHN